MALHSRGFVLLALMVLLPAFCAQATDAWESIGVSTASLGRGGCDVAVGDSALSQISNPATLSLAPRDARLVEGSAQVIIPTIHWSTWVDSSTSRSIAPFGNIGLTVPWNQKLTFGLALYSRAGALTDYRNMRSALDVIRQRNIHGELADGALLFDAAYKLTDKLSIGAGVRGEFLTSKDNVVLGPAEVSLDRVWAVGPGYQLGLHYQATKKLAFGLGYMSPGFLKNVSDGELDAKVLSKAYVVHFGDANLHRWQTPQKVTVGAAYDLTDWWKLVGEARWVNFQRTFLRRMVVETNDFPRMQIPLELDLHDEYVLAAGSEFKLSDRWKLDAGYNYTTNPVSSSHMFPLAPTTVQHHLTMGLRYERAKWWVGGGYIYAFPQSQSAPGFTKIPFGNDFASSRFEHQQHCLFFGVGFRW